MKSKSYDLGILGHPSSEKRRQNRNFDFVNLYKSSSETNAPVIEKHIVNDSKPTRRHNLESPNCERSPNKRNKKEKREPIDISQINFEGTVLNNSVNSAGDTSQVASTPLGNHKYPTTTRKVKSIMKNTSVSDDVIDMSQLDTSTLKSKKRNKSVSFMLEDNDDMVIKKTKSDDSTSDPIINASDPNIKAKFKRHFKKDKKHHQAEKENTIDGNHTMEVDSEFVNGKPNKKSKIKHEQLNPVEAPLKATSDCSQNEKVSKNKKKSKKVKKPKQPGNPTGSTDKNENDSQEVRDKVKKPKKTKIFDKSDKEEPVQKLCRSEPKPDVIAADLEHLSIGDNAHTLTNLLDEMTVVDKTQRKKLKQNFNKSKKPKVAATTAISEKAEDVQEKVKWRRRKWNKDTKADPKEASLETTVIVENLPLSLLFSYKKVLAEHFVKFGLIKSVGIAEVYATDVSKPVFTTTINFYSDGAATQAVGEDKMIFESSRIRVKRVLAPTETTLVVRSYGALTTQFLSSTFSSAGRIRNIRHSIKGKHAMITFFVEFDGPETVERALKLATDVKIGGKKIYVSKFENRIKKSKQKKTNENEGSDADQSEDSQD